jgi:hypothetical protein
MKNHQASRISLRSSGLRLLRRLERKAPALGGPGLIRRAIFQRARSMSQVELSRRYGYFAGESFRAPIEAYIAIHLPNHALHDACAEAASSGG